MKQIIISLNENGVVDTDWVGNLNSADAAWMLAAVQLEFNYQMLKNVFKRMENNDTQVPLQPSGAGPDPRPAESGVQSNEEPREG